MRSKRSSFPGQTLPARSAGVASLWKRLARPSSSSSSGRIGLTAKRPLFAGRRARLGWNVSGRARVPVRLSACANKITGDERSGHCLDAIRCSTTSYNGEQRFKPGATRMAAAGHESEACGSKTRPRMGSPLLLDPTRLCPPPLRIIKRMMLFDHLSELAFLPHHPPIRLSPSFTDHHIRRLSARSRLSISMKFLHLYVAARHGHVPVRRPSRRHSRSSRSRSIHIPSILLGPPTMNQHGRRLRSPLRRQRPLRRHPSLCLRRGQAHIHSPMSIEAVMRTMNVTIQHCYLLMKI